MPKTMWVRAKDPAIKVPIEGAPRRYIGETPTQIELTTYYVRRLSEGDLEEVPAPIAPSSPAPTPNPLQQEAK